MDSDKYGRRAYDRRCSNKFISDFYIRTSLNKYKYSNFIIGLLRLFTEYELEQCFIQDCRYLKAQTSYKALQGGTKQIVGLSLSKEKNLIRLRKCTG